MIEKSHQNEQDMPVGYPTETIESVTLRDGTPVNIRPIRPDDAPRLQAGFARLSPQSIYLRFLQTFRELSDKQAREFATVDYLNRMALVASIPGEGDERLIGVARYSMVAPANPGGLTQPVAPAEPGLAEGAIVVGDEFHNRGLGTILLDRLVKYARAHGVTAFLATVHLTNSQIMRFIQRSGFPYEKKMIEPGIWEVRVRLEDDHPES